MDNNNINTCDNKYIINLLPKIEAKLNMTINGKSGVVAVSVITVGMTVYGMYKIKSNKEIELAKLNKSSEHIAA